MTGWRCSVGHCCFVNTSDPLGQWAGCCGVAGGACGLMLRVCLCPCVEHQVISVCVFARVCWDLQVRGSQFQQPLMEFSGACEGCGETPYVKRELPSYGPEGGRCCCSLNKENSKLGGNTHLVNRSVLAGSCRQCQQHIVFDGCIASHPPSYAFFLTTLPVLPFPPPLPGCSTDADVW